MSISNDYDEITTKPISSNLVSNTPTYLKNIANYIAERFVDWMYGFGSGETSTMHVDYVPLGAQGSDPPDTEDQIRPYGKDAAGKCELHTIDEDGNVIQMTSAGQAGSATTDVVCQNIDVAASCESAGYTESGSNTLSNDISGNAATADKVDDFEATNLGAKVIEKKTFTASTGETFTLSGDDTGDNAEYYKIFMDLRLDAPTGTPTIGLYFNGDTGNNYRHASYGYGNVGLKSGQGVNASGIQLTPATGWGDTQKWFIVIEILAKTAEYAKITGNFTGVYLSANDILGGFCAGGWDSTGEITSITVFPNAINKDMNGTIELRRYH